MMNKTNDTIKSIFKSRSLKYGSNSVILIAIVLAIAVFVNILVNMADLKWDLTANKMFSIGDATKTIMKDLKKDVQIYGLFDPGKMSGRNQYTDVVELLKQYKNPKIKVEYKDPDKNPGLLKTLDPDNFQSISQDTLFIVKSGNKIRKISSYELVNTQYDQGGGSSSSSTAEMAFTGAIKYVTSDKTPVVYFTEGHGENSVDTDYTTVKNYLQKNNYEVKSVNLTTEGKVPDNAEILIVAAPKKDLSSGEKDNIKAYLKKGGKAVFLFDYNESNQSFAQFEEVMSEYGMSLNYDKIKENDDSRHVQNRDFDILPDLQQTDINQSLDPQNFAMIIPTSRSINILKNAKEGLTVTSLLKTSSKAVGIQIDSSKGKDIPGPLDIAVAAEYKGGAAPAKLLVMGNGSFMGDKSLSQYEQYSVNGLYFFLNSLLWMQDKKDDVVISPKSYDAPRLQIDALKANVIALALIIVFPLMILGAGLLIWTRRRHL